MAFNYIEADPLEFVRGKFLGPDSKKPYTIRNYFTLKCLADFFTTKFTFVQKSSLKILDYGSGPYMVNVISAAPVASEIVLAEYSKPYREFIVKWLNDVCPFDWSPVFCHVVQTLEGKSEEEAVLRKKELQNKLLVVACDVTQPEKIIAEGFEGPYDVIMSFLCLEAAYKTLEVYKLGLSKLAALVKEGGYLLLSISKRDPNEVPFYRVNGVKYYDTFHISKAFLVESLVEFGFADICDQLIPITPDEDTNCHGFYFFSACKLKEQKGTAVSSMEN